MRNKKQDKQLPKLLTIQQVAEVLNVHTETLRRWDKSGRLKAVRLGPRGDRRYNKANIEKLLKEAKEN